jgi:hypothetical protein
MKKFQTKLALEQNKLSLHLKHLNDFVRTPRFDLIDRAEQVMIYDQIRAMHDLNIALSERCRFHGITPEPDPYAQD